MSAEEKIQALTNMLSLTEGMSVEQKNYLEGYLSGYISAMERKEVDAA